MIKLGWLRTPSMCAANNVYLDYKMSSRVYERFGANMCLLAILLILLKLFFILQPITISQCWDHLFTSNSLKPHKRAPT